MEQSININFGIPNGHVVSYWIRLEEKPDVAETVTPEEAAKVIDALFQIDSCAGESGIGGTVDDTIQEGMASMLPIPQDEVMETLQAAFDAIDYDPCKYIEGSFDYEKEIIVYRSHINIPYNLVLNNGKNVSVKVVTMEIDDYVQVSGTSVTLDYPPLLGEITANIEIASVDGSTLYFEAEINEFVRFRYTTQYDVVTINVFGTEEEAQECKCLAFYQGLVSELKLTPPEQDDNAIQYIGCDGGSGSGGSESGIDDLDPWPEICYQRSIYQQVCRCSETVENSISNISVVPCDTPFASNTEQGAYDSFQEARYITDYISCPAEEGNWEGADVDFYEDTCCEPPSNDWVAPMCQSIIRELVGGYDVEGGRDGRGENAIYIPVPPPDGICGTHETIYEVEAQDCCDSEFYENLEYDEVNSVEILADSSNGLVFWDGGFINPDDEYDRSSVTVTVRGSGFWLDAHFTEKSIIASSGCARIYTDEDACGSCTVEIADNCSETSGVVKATDGIWFQFDQVSGWNYSATIQMACPGSFCTSHNLLVDVETEYDQINGKYALTTGRNRPSGQPDITIERSVWFSLGGGGCDPCNFSGSGNGIARCDQAYSTSYGTTYGFSVKACNGHQKTYPTHPSCGGTGTLYGSYFRHTAVNIFEWIC